jgi:Na+-driven multidrug efflux pump
VQGPIIKPATDSSPHYCFRSFPGTLYDGKQYYKGGGKAKFAMVAMIIPAIVNIILDIIFIKVMDWDVCSFSYVHFLFYVLPLFCGFCV